MTPALDLYNPEKPYARFYRSEDDTCIQIHTRKIDGLGFGRIGWRLTASICDEDGFTIEGDEGLLILAGAGDNPLTHEVLVQSETVSDVAAYLEAQRLAFAARAYNASIVWHSAQSVE